MKASLTGRVDDRQGRGCVCKEREEPRLLLFNQADYSAWICRQRWHKQGRMQAARRLIVRRWIAYFSCCVICSLTRWLLDNEAKQAVVWLLLTVALTAPLGDSHSCRPECCVHGPITLPSCPFCLIATDLMNITNIIAAKLLNSDSITLPRPGCSI